MISQYQTLLRPKNGPVYQTLLGSSNSQYQTVLGPKTIHTKHCLDINCQYKQEISLKKIFGGSQILTINATKFAVLDEIPIYPFAYWNLKPAKLWSCFCLSFAWFCAHLTLFAERYASESFFFYFKHSPARVWEQCFKS